MNSRQISSNPWQGVESNAKGKRRRWQEWVGDRGSRGCCRRGREFNRFSRCSSDLFALYMYIYVWVCARARVCVRKFVRSCGTQFAQSYCEADQQGDKRDTDVALALLPRSLLTSSKAKYKNYSSEVPRGASFLDSHLSCAMEGALSTAENQNVAPREAELP